MTCFSCVWSSRIYLPASLGSQRVWFPPVVTTMKALTPEPVSKDCDWLRSPCLSRLNFRAFRLQPPYCHFACLGLARYRVCSPCKPSHRPSAVSGLTSRSSSGRCVGSEVRDLLARSPTGLAETSSFCYGLLVLLKLLSTFSVENAVTFGYGAVTTSPIRTCTR